MSNTETRSGRVALFIDGENISHDLAGKVIVGAGKFGNIVVKRVYGGVRRIPGWESTTGLKLVHSGEGKNAADLLMTVEAMDFAAKGNIDVFAIASSDGDHTHLATYLREAGFFVVGLGEDKAPKHFCKSCSQWVPLGGGKIEDTIAGLLKQHKDGVLMQRINSLLKSNGLTLAHVEKANWRSFFKQNSDRFEIAGEGQTSRVRVR